MNLTVFTTTTNPIMRGDNFEDAFKCYCDLADELIIVDGSTTDKAPDFEKRSSYVRYVYNKWPQEFNWPLIGQQFQRGYEAASGDWVLHADLDFIFHEKDFDNIRKALTDHPKAPALSFWKYQFILPDRYNLKSRLVLAVNKRVYGDRIRFNSGGDLCQPSLDGAEIKPDYVAESRIPFYNYEKMTKNADQIMADCGRMDRAFFKHFGFYQLSNDGSDESAFDGYIRLMRGRFHKPQEHIKLEQHPKYIQETINSLRPKQFGYNGLGLLGGSDNRYFNEAIHA